jgi:hypothetical protein
MSKKLVSKARNNQLVTMLDSVVNDITIKRRGDSTAMIDKSANEKNTGNEIISYVPSLFFKGT